MAGWPDTKIPNDAERFLVDPSIRPMVVGQANHLFAESTSEMSRFETEILATGENLENLTDLFGYWVDQVDDQIPIKQRIESLFSKRLSFTGGWINVTI